MASRPKNNTSKTRSRSAVATAPTEQHDNSQRQQNYHRNARAFEPSTLNRDARTVQAVLATEDPVAIWDWRTGEVVDEVLVASGCRAESSTPLLRDHNQYSVLAQLGSVTAVTHSGDEVRGLLTFGRDLDADSEGVWKRVDQGLLRSGSVGYFYQRSDYETIPAGESRVIAGRTYKASKDRPLRIVKRWSLLEYSMVVIPADARATLRDSQGTLPDDSQNSQQVAPKRTQSSEDKMKKFLRFLHQHGLATSVTNETEALDWARSGNLSAELITELDRLCKEEGVTFDAGQARAKHVETGTRSGASAAATQPTASQTQPVDAQAAVAAERSRIAAIRNLQRDYNGISPAQVPQDLVDQAIDQGWDETRTQREFVASLRTSRAEGAPAVHSRSSSQINRRVLQAALMQRCGITPDSPVLQSDPAAALQSRRREMDVGWAIGCPQNGQRRDDLDQAFDIVSQQGLRGASFMRIAELCCELTEPGRRFHDTQEVMERAFSSGDFSAVFGAVVHLEMLAAYERTPHTYDQWCEVVELGDFNTHKANDMGQVGRLKKMGRNGGDAALLNVEDTNQVSIAVERYAGQLIVDDQTLINDAFGVTGMLPGELGETCQCMVADLAFTELLNSANLADGTSRARFNSTDGNLVSVSGSLSETAWNSIAAALKNVKVGSRRINVGQAVVIAGTTLAPTIRKWMGSNFQSDQMNNPHRGTYTVLEDSAIDLGVTNPANNEASIAGTPASFYVLGTGQKRSIKFAWRRGTGRGPVTSPAINLATATTGQWGLAWKTYLDMGAAFQRRIGAVKATIS